MSKRLLKKIILGSVLTSAVVSSTAIFSINASKQNFANKNINTSSFKDIYTQKGEPSTASVNKLTPAPNALTNKANSNKWNQQMTPYVSKIQKPVLKFVGFKEPSSPTATDGKAWYKAENYDSRHIVWGLFHQGPNSDIFNRANLLSSGNGAEKTLEITDLKFGDEFQLNLAPKNGYTWNDGTTDKIFDPTWRRIGKQVKKPFIKFVGFKDPSTGSSADGEAYYEIKNYNATYMFWSLSTKNTTHSDTFNRSSLGHTATLATVKNLKYGDNFKFYFYPKKGYVWDDGTTNNVEDSSFRLISYKLKKLLITQTTKQPTTTTSTDGEVVYTLTNFDPSKMNLSLVPGSGGILGKYDPQTQQIKITGLKAGQHAQIQVELKTINSDTSLQKIINAHGVEDDNNNSSPGMNVNRRSIAVPLGSESKGNSAIEFSTHLKSWKSSDVNPTLSDILSNASFSKDITGFIVWDLALSKWTYNGKSIESKANAAEFILDTQNSAGSPSQTKLQIWVNHFDSTTREVFIDSMLTLSKDATGEDNGAMTDLEFTTRKIVYSWDDNTRKLTSKSFTATQTHVGLQKPTFTQVVKQPTTTTSTDGEVVYTLTNFDPSKMNLSLVPGSGGILGKYDPQTQQIKITGLKAGQHAQIQVVPENNETYLDGTRIQKSSILVLTLKNFRIQKPTFTQVVKQPTTTTSTDGEVVYTLINFDPSKMTIALVPGSSGTLGTYDPQTQQIKITGLSNGQTAQIEFKLKNKGDIWIDGTTKIITELTKFHVISKTIPLHIVIPLSVLAALMIVLLIYAQRFHFKFKFIEKNISLNLRLLKVRVNVMRLKILNWLFKNN